MTNLRCTLSRWLFLVVAALPSLSLGIVGGVPASEGEVAGQVALVDVSRDAGTCTGADPFCKQFCSGVMIARQWVLTAAHCVNNVLLPNLRVVAGTRDLATADASHLLGVERTVVHEQFTIGAPFNNDVALVKLLSPVDLPVASVAEAAAFATFAGNAALHDDGVMVSGWGRLSSIGGFPTLLQRVGVDFLPNAVCESAYNQVSTIRYVAGNMLCAAETTPQAIEQDDAGDLSPHDDSGEGVCNYDSGGPLTFAGNGFRQVAGLTSFAPQGNCASTLLPSVFTRVANYAAWIESAGKGAGDNFGDLALTMTGDTAVVPGGVAAVTVVLRNASGLPSGVTALPSTNLTGAGFTVLAPEGMTLALTGTPSSLSCAPVSGGYRCTSTTTLAPSSSRQASFTITPATTDQQVTEVVAEAFADTSNSLVDYRQGNDRRQHRILFSSQPDLALELAGFTQDVVNITPTTADGRAWIMGRIMNRSSAHHATAVSLQPVLPAGFQWEAWEGLDECASVVCVLPSVGANEGRWFRLRVFSPGAVAGAVRLSVASGNGDFPSNAGDIEGSVDVAFNVVVDDSPVDPSPSPSPEPESPSVPGASGSSGGGAVDLSWLGLVIAAGLAAVSRKPSGTNKAR